MSSYNWLKRVFRLFYTEIGRRPILLKGSPFGYTDPKQDMSQGAQELGCARTKAHMNNETYELQGT